MPRENTTSTTKAKGTSNPLKIAAGLRTALDVGAAGFAFGAPLFTDDTNGTTTENPPIPTTPARIAWAVTEWAFFLIMIAYLISRYGINGQQAQNNPSANNILMMRVVIALCSGTAASLLSSDLEGETYRSLAGIILVAITSFIVESTQEKFEKKDGQRNTDLYRPKPFQLPTGKTLYLEQTFTNSDMALLLKPIINNFSAYTFPDQLPHYALNRALDDDQTIVVTPPMIKFHHAQQVTRFHQNLGFGELGLYFDKTLSPHLARSIFDDTANVTETTPYLYKIFIPTKSYIADNLDLWCITEVQIQKRQTDGNNHFDITIACHNPVGTAKLNPQDFFSLAKAIFNRLTNAAPAGFNINREHIHFKSQADLTNNNNDNNINIAAVIADENQLDANITAENMPNNPSATPRLNQVNAAHSSVIVLEDLKNLLRDEPLNTSTYPAQNIRQLKKTAVMNTLNHIPEDERKSFTARMVISQAVTMAEALHP